MKSWGCGISARPGTRAALLAALLVAAPGVAGCGDEPDSGSEFPGAPTSAERQPEPPAPVPDDDSTSAPDQPVPRSARLALSNVSKSHWPLTVTEGVVRCQRISGARVVSFVTPDGKTYGVNAAAVSQGLRRIDPIRRRDPVAPDDRIDLAPVLDRGLQLCE